MSGPTDAVILAAGRGSRLGRETNARPKALLPIGSTAAGHGDETNLLRRQIELLRNFGVEQVVVVVGYLREFVTAEIQSWAPGICVVENPTSEIDSSGSLHSFQFAARSPFGVLDGHHSTLLMDADIVYHRGVLELILDTPDESTMLVCDRNVGNGEEVLVYGTPKHPRFMGKGLVDELVAGCPCLGEAVGIVKFAPQDHRLVRCTMEWLLGDPDAPPGTLEHRGFGSARRGTEHEELTERFMRYGKMRALIFSGDELPFLEVDTPEDYQDLRVEVYPRILAAETGS